MCANVRHRYSEMSYLCIVNQKNDGRVQNSDDHNRELINHLMFNL